MPFIPHTEQDKYDMLQAIGAETIAELFDEIPNELRYPGFEKIPTGINEQYLLAHAHKMAKHNQELCLFLGAGAYEHHIPAAVWDIASRGEFYTAYTPYQAEASQGTLQLLYEFQTMICTLTGMDVANSSLYDGATATAEAILMAARLKKDIDSHKVLIAGTIHPLYLQAIRSIISEQNITITELPYNAANGTISSSDLEQYAAQNYTALVIQQPNFFGCLEDVDLLTDWAHAHNILVIGCVNPISLGLLKPPGLWGSQQQGADIACGEGQPLGAPLAGGGPYFGFFSTKMINVRQMPGRLIGKTQDKLGREGYTLTLQAREQHIRRGKATSNICTNQGLLVTAATIHMSLIGPHGLQNIAKQCHIQTQYLVQQLTNIPGVKINFNAPYFHECVLKFDKPLAPIITQLQHDNILAGLELIKFFPSLPNTLLVCATEMRTNEEIDHFAKSLAKIMNY